MPVSPLRHFSFGGGRAEFLGNDPGSARGKRIRIIRTELHRDIADERI